MIYGPDVSIVEASVGKHNSDSAFNAAAPVRTNILTSAKPLRFLFEFNTGNNSLTEISSEPPTHESGEEHIKEPGRETVTHNDYAKTKVLRILLGASRYQYDSSKSRERK